LLLWFQEPALTVKKVQLIPVPDPGSGKNLPQIQENKNPDPDTQHWSLIKVQNTAGYLELNYGASSC
jgi:hypothetical protein